MKKFLAVSLGLVAMVGFVACGGDDGGGTQPTPDAIQEGVQPDASGGEVLGEGVSPTETVGEGTGDVAKEAAQEVVCTPNCTGKVCGSDGCGGSCGECKDGDKTLCLPDGSACVKPCDIAGTVTKWDKVGVLASLETPGDKAVVEQKCPDFSGDGKGDNGLKGLASTVNGELAKMVQEGKFNIAMEFKGVTDFENTASFTLNGLLVDPDPTDTSTPKEKWQVDPKSYNPADCTPLIAFKDAKIAGGKLSGGPTTFSLTLAIEQFGGGALTFTLEKGQVSMTVKDDKVTAEDGVLAGVLTKDQVDATLAKAKEQCNVPKPPDFCNYLSMAESFLPMLFDLDQNGDGKKDAASLCLLFSLRGATITGLVPPETK